MFAMAKFSPMMAGGEQRYVVNAIDYDGSADRLRMGSGLTGAANGKAGLLSFWLRVDGGDGTLMFIMSGTPSGFRVKRETSNKLFITMQNTGGTDILNINTTSTLTTSATWKHILASWDLNAGVSHLYLSDASDKTETTLSNDTIDYTTSDFFVAVESNVLGNYFNGCLSEVYFAPSYLDLSSSANRLKFISGGKPVSLGSNGSIPTGSQPLIYLKDPAATVGTNSGSGGNFGSIGGAPADASTRPSD